jgi:hypothetical protein
MGAGRWEREAGRWKQKQSQVTGCKIQVAGFNCEREEGSENSRKLQGASSKVQATRWEMEAKIVGNRENGLPSPIFMLL